MTARRGIFASRKSCDSPSGHLLFVGAAAMSAAAEASSAHYQGTTYEVDPGIQEENQGERHSFNCSYLTLFIGLLAGYMALSYPGLIKNAATTFPAAELKVHVSGDTAALRATSTILGENQSFHTGPGPLHLPDHALREQANSRRSCGLLQPSLPGTLSMGLPTPLFVRRDTGGPDCPACPLQTQGPAGLA